MISILLAAYNGKKFIAEQIESLLSQTVQDFRLFICDDCSTDDTLSIIKQYAEKYPEKIFVSQNKVNSGSPKYNFIKMMIEHKDNYVMLCDQDDVWLPEKIEKSLIKMREMESQHGALTPILIHTDLKIVDRNLEVISDSYEKAMHSDFARTSLNSLIVQNTTAGCSVMYNRALADLIYAEPEFMAMHDWWLFLVASAFGKIGALYEPLALYRQHGDNDTGIREANLLKRAIQEISHYGDMAKAIRQTYIQAESLLKIYGDKLSDAQRNMLTEYLKIPRMKPFYRLHVLSKHKTYKKGLARKAAQIIVVLTERRVAG